jgi:hypothetical protein
VEANYLAFQEREQYRDGECLRLHGHIPTATLRIRFDLVVGNDAACCMKVQQSRRGEIKHKQQEALGRIGVTLYETVAFASCR